MCVTSPDGNFKRNDPIENSGENVMTSFSPIKSLWDFSDNQGRLTP